MCMSNVITIPEAKLKPVPFSHFDSLIIIVISLVFIASIVFFLKLVAGPKDGDQCMRRRQADRRQERDERWRRRNLLSLDDSPPTIQRTSHPEFVSCAQDIRKIVVCFNCFASHSSAGN